MSAKGRKVRTARARAEGERASAIFSPFASVSPLRVDAAADRLAQKAEKQAKKALKFGLSTGPEPAEWVPIDGLWLAYAVDGKGHHDGDGKYTCQVPVKDFGEHLFLGGEARMYLCGGMSHVFRLPSVAPPPNAALTFQLQVEQRLGGGLGRLTMVDGVEVRAPSQ